jgi:hypothetical protein
MGRLLLAPVRRLVAACLLSLVLTGVASADPPIAAVNTEKRLGDQGL